MEEEMQPNTGRDNRLNEGFNNQEEGLDQFQQDPNQMMPNEKPNRIGTDNRLHLDRMIDDLSKNEKFEKKEKEINDKLNSIVNDKMGSSFSNDNKYIFMINKIILLITFTEFLFQRFDVVTLFLCIVVIFIELEIFTYKHLYKWLLVLISSFLLDAFVLIDIAPVSIFFLILNLCLNRRVMLI
jgi:hypothetical protein